MLPDDQSQYNDLHAMNDNKQTHWYLLFLAQNSNFYTATVLSTACTTPCWQVGSPASCILLCTWTRPSAWMSWNVTVLTLVHWRLSPVRRCKRWFGVIYIILPLVDWMILASPVGHRDFHVPLMPVRNLHYSGIALLVWTEKKNT